MLLDKKTIGNKIKKGRELKGTRDGIKYTGQMLADELGISRGFLGDIENGRTPAPKKLLKEIIKICGLPANYFDLIVKPSDDNIVSTLFAGTGSLIPSHFTDPDLARVYIAKHEIFSSDDFELNEKTDEEVLDIANEMLNYANYLKNKHIK